jgi:hypothetical protein
MDGISFSNLLSTLVWLGWDACMAAASGEPAAPGMMITSTVMAMV